MKRHLRTTLTGIIAVLLCAWLAGAARATEEQRAFPAPGEWEFTFKPGASFISYFLKGNVHDTLGYVRTMKGAAGAVLDDSGKMTAASVQFSFIADVMSSDDEARDKRMDKKFMEIHLYPEVSFSGSAAGPGLEQQAALATATREHPVAFDLEGTLTIHGATRPVTIPAIVYPENGLLITEGATTLQLQDYNIKNPSLLVFRTENTVKINFHIALQPSGSPAH